MRGLLNFILEGGGIYHRIAGAGPGRCAVVETARGVRACEDGPLATRPDGLPYRGDCLLGVAEGFRTKAKMCAGPVESLPLRDAAKPTTGCCSYRRSRPGGFQASNYEISCEFISRLTTSLDNVKM
jgi:hypothetical protein